MAACEISLFDEPTPLGLNDLDGSPLDVFFATGVVNPFGPTLSVVAAAGEPSEGKLRVGGKELFDYPRPNM